MQSPVLYVVPNASILGRHALVPVGDARRARTLMVHHAKQRWALATAVASGTSTVVP
jgi:hypothetical protein